MIPGQREVSIPGLVRIKPGALDRVGIYVRRAGYRSVALIHVVVHCTETADDRRRGDIVSFVDGTDSIAQREP